MAASPWQAAVDAERWRLATLAQEESQAADDLPDQATGRLGRAAAESSVAIRGEDEEEEGEELFCDMEGKSLHQIVALADRVLRTLRAPSGAAPSGAAPAGGEAHVPPRRAELRLALEAPRDPSPRRRAPGARRRRLRLWRRRRRRLRLQRRRNRLSRLRVASIRARNATAFFRPCRAWPATGARPMARGSGRGSSSPMAPALFAATPTDPHEGHA